MSQTLTATGRALEASGVSREAVFDTLPNAGLPEMRQFVEEELFFDEDKQQYVSLNVHGQKNTSPRRLRLAFNLLAKEIQLSKAALRVLSFKEFSDAVCGRSDRYTPDSFMDTDMIFVLDFYEDGADFPLTPFDAMLVRSFVRRYLEEGLGFAAHTDIPLIKATKWWPQNFLLLIDEYSTNFLVK